MSQLNIKDPVVVSEARDLAALLGTSTTEAVRRAVHDRLERERRERVDDTERRFEALMAISAEASKLFPPGTTSDHTGLYDENGLPR